MSDNKAGVDPTLTKAIDALVKEVTLDAKEDVLGDDGEPKKGPNGRYLKRQKYSLTDVVKVIDRKIKLEQLRLDVKDDGYGAGFDDAPEPEEKLK
jgi:hypothetical protein